MPNLLDTHYKTQGSSLLKKDHVLIYQLLLNSNDLPLLIHIGPVP